MSKRDKSKKVAGLSAHEPDQITITFDDISRDMQEAVKSQKGSKDYADLERMEQFASNIYHQFFAERETRFTFSLFVGVLIEIHYMDRHEKKPITTKEVIQ